jgi:hypothetical protein
VSFVPFHKLPLSSGLLGFVIANQDNPAASVRVNLSATTNPTITDDSSDGWGVGSMWINTASGDVFWLTDATVGAAQWQTGGGGGSGSLQASWNYTAHGFSVGDCVRRTAAGWAKSQANTETSSEVAGIVSAVADADNFTIAYGGMIDYVSAGTVGDVLFLSESTAGLLTVTEPTATGHVSKPMAIKVSGTQILIINMRGILLSANPTVSSDTFQGRLSSGAGAIETCTFGTGFSKAGTTLNVNIPSTELADVWSYSGI